MRDFQSTEGNSNSDVDTGLARFPTSRHVAKEGERGVERQVISTAKMLKLEAQAYAH